MCKTRQNPLRKSLPHGFVRFWVRDSMPFAIERIDEPAREACFFVSGKGLVWS